MSRYLEARPPQGAAEWLAPHIVVADGRGGLLVADALGVPVVYRFDRRGNLIGKIESSARDRFTPIRALAIGESGEVHIFHAAHSIFDANLRWIRRLELPESLRPNYALSLPDGNILLQGMSGTPDLFGAPFHIIGATGGATRSFGLGRNEAVHMLSGSRARSIAKAGPLSFWGPRRDRYVVEEWGLQGNPLRVVVRTAPWFRAWESWDGRVDTSVPPPRLMSVFQDGETGLLWTLSLVPRSDWKPDSARHPETDEKSRMPSAADWDRIDESVLEVLDLRSKTLVATQRFRMQFSGFLANGLLAQSAPGEGRSAVVVLWRPSLVR